MNKLYLNSIKAVLISLAVFSFAALCWSGNTNSTLAQTAPASPPVLPASSPTPAPAATAPFDQAKALADLAAQIKGKEQEPAETVFKNIQMFKGMPAARLLRVMEMGYARSLGVDCTHCHVAGQWEKEDKPAKQVARDMAKMVQTINTDLLKNIKNLKGPDSIVNCTTCHRGQVKPALNLPAAKS